ncbi:MAG TPA: signal peptide peptidase SppA, partial [Bryobacteraceae bacterium]
MKKFLLGVLIGFLFAGLGLVIVIFAVARFGARPPEISRDSVLVYRLEGAVPESPGITIPLPFFEGKTPPTVRDHWELLRKAAADSRIRAVLFMPQGVDAGWAKLEEIRSGIEAFRKSGKPVYAYLRAPRAREYYLATAADRIYMAPEDFLDLKGLRAELMYLRGTLDKIGVQIEIQHAGKYKDAGDTFTRKSASPETLEVMNSILDDLYGQLTARFASARNKTPEQIRAIIDQGPFVAKDALAAGLIDGLQYQDQIYGELRGKLKLAEVRKVALKDYQKVAPESLGLETGRKIALVVAEGDIVRGDGESPFGGEGFVSSAGMTRLLQQVGNDGSVRGVIVRIDSPGGDGFASDEIWREMGLLSKKKPLVISMSDLAASGGYYMAMTGDPILAYPGTFTGSIGVFYGKADLHGLYDKLGVQKQILSRGRFAEIDSDYTPLSDAARVKLQSSIEQFYRTFVERVAQGRRRPYGQIEPIAQGRVWLGSQAKANGLIDDFGGLDKAIELVKRKAGIPTTEKVRLAAYPPRRTIFEQLFGPQPSVSLPESRVLSLARRFSTRTWLEGGFFKAMPYSIE